MRLTRYSDYALRVLMYLGLNPGRVCTVGEIARAYRVSENHLMKVVQDLARSGVLQTIRGRRGGVRLARRPVEIHLGEVVRATEADLALVECFDGGDQSCPIAGPCRLSGVLEEALGAFFAVLDRRTLADLLLQPGSLQRRLVPAAPGA